MANDKIEGEGNYTAAREYDEKASEHAKDSAKVAAAAQRAKQALDSDEAAELEKAETAGKDKARH